MSKENKHPAESWRLMKFLLGREGQEKVCATGLAIPVLRSVAYSPCFNDPNQEPAGDEVFLRGAESASYIEWPADPRYRDALKIHLEEVFKLGKPTAPTLERLQRQWQELRSASVFRKAYPQAPWGAIAGWILIPSLALAAAGSVVWWRRRPARLAFREELAGMGMISPWALGFFAFVAFPVVMSLLLAFTRWSGLTTMDGAEWLGWDNFRQLLGYDAASGDLSHDATFRRAVLVTTWYALLAVPSSQVLALGAAMLLNREVRGVGVFRAIWYLPSVLAGVGMAIMWKWVFHHEHGLMNALLQPLLDGLQWLWPAALAEAAPPHWFEKDAPVWGVPAFAIVNLWLVGGTMMIYLAGLKGIPGELYEAAQIDGATGPRRLWNVTLPMLSPVILFNVIMAIIASFQIFTQVFVMTGGGPGIATHFFVFYLYKRAFDLHDMGYASAMAWLLLLIVLTLTLMIMRGTRRVVYYEGLR